MGGLDLRENCPHSDDWGPTTLDGKICFLCSKRVDWSKTNDDSNVDQRIIQYKIASEAAKPDLPSTVKKISESGKYFCPNKECKNCYTDPKPKTRLRCKIGFHDFHKRLNEGYFCRFCGTPESYGPYMGEGIC